MLAKIGADVHQHQVFGPWLKKKCSAWSNFDFRNFYHFHVVDTVFIFSRHVIVQFDMVKNLRLNGYCMKVYGKCIAL